MGVTDLCIDNGGFWCYADAAWSDGGVLGQLAIMAVPLMLLVMGVSVVRRVIKGVRSLTESRKGDL